MQKKICISRIKVNIINFWFPFRFSIERSEKKFNISPLNLLIEIRIGRKWNSICFDEDPLFRPATSRSNTRYKYILKFVLRTVNNIVDENARKKKRKKKKKKLGKYFLGKLRESTIRFHCVCIPRLSKYCNSTERLAFYFTNLRKQLTHCGKQNLLQRSSSPILTIARND